MKNSPRFLISERFFDAVLLVGAIFCFLAVLLSLFAER